MVGIPTVLVTRLRKKFPNPTIDPTWLQDCYDWIVEEFGVQPNQLEDAYIHLETQYLGSDLAGSTIEGSGLPLDLDSLEKGRVATLQTGGAVLCQINAITEIGNSAFSLRNVRQTQIDKADMAGIATEEEGAEDGQPPDDGEDYSIPTYPREMLRFVLSDGFRILQAMEYRRLPSLSLDQTALGCKIVLDNVLVRRGIALLEPECVTIYPNTKLEDLDAMRDVLFSRSLRIRMGLREIDPEEEALHQAQQNILDDESTGIVAATAAPRLPTPPIILQPASATHPTDSQQTMVLPSRPVQSRTGSTRTEAEKAERLARIQRSMLDLGTASTVHMESAKTQMKTVGIKDSSARSKSTNVTARKKPSLETRADNPVSLQSTNAMDIDTLEALGEVESDPELTHSREVAINELIMQEMEQVASTAGIRKCTPSPTKSASIRVTRKGTRTAVSVQSTVARVPPEVIEVTSDIEYSTPSSSTTQRLDVESQSSRTATIKNLQKTPGQRSKAMGHTEVIELSD